MSTLSSVPPLRSTMIQPYSRMRLLVQKGIIKAAVMNFLPRGESRAIK